MFNLNMQVSDFKSLQKSYNGLRKQFTLHITCYPCFVEPPQGFCFPLILWLHLFFIISMAKKSMSQKVTTGD